MRIAVYARVSSENQADRGTIAAQVDFLRRYADLNGLTIVSKYHDEAVAGPTPLVKRPEGLRMLQDARSGKFQAVVFGRVDRFARSLRELLEAQAAFDAVNVALRLPFCRPVTPAADPVIPFPDRPPRSCRWLCCSRRRRPPIEGHWRHCQTPRPPQIAG
jgi:Resolvase, N terminal domain